MGPNDSLIYPNVHLEEGVIIEPGCILGTPPQGKSPGELKLIIGKNSLIRSGTIIYAGSTLGENFQSGNRANIREYSHIGKNVSIGTLSVIEHSVEIEDDVRVHSQVFIPEFTVLKKSCWLGPNVVITNAKYPRSPNVKNQLKGAVVQEAAIIGANSTILPDLIIGCNSIIGAGSVVTKNIPPSEVHCGNPANFLKKKSALPYEKHMTPLEGKYNESTFS